MKKIKFGNILILLGVLCILASGGLFFYNQRENQHSQDVIDVVLPELKKEIIQHQNEPQTPVENDSPYYGILVFPTLGIELPVSREYSEQQLKETPCVFGGPDLVICGHAIKAQFAFLKQLSQNDSVFLILTSGETTEYKVVDSEVLQPTDIQEMLESGYDLTLFTCTNANTARYTVRFDKVG